MKINRQIMAALGKAIPSADVRKQLMGVYYHRGDNGHVTMATTDGLRLVEVTIEADGSDAKAEAIIPVSVWKEASASAPTAKEVNRIVTRRHPKPPADPPKIRVGKKLATVAVSKNGSCRHIVADLIGGKYPNYRMCLPKYEVLPPIKDGKQAIKIHVDAAHLEAVAHAMLQLVSGMGNSHERKHNLISMTVPLDRRAPILFERASADDEGNTFRGMVMPCLTYSEAAEEALK